jgi:hypothetical protein
MKKQDLTGKRFGQLTVAKHVAPDRWNHIQWQCVCDCGGTKVAKTSDLNAGLVKSCGCMNHLKGEKSSTWKGGKIEVPCANPSCNKTKSIYPARQETYDKFYCSNECRYEHRPATIMGTDNPRFKEKIVVACAQCGKEFGIIPCHAVSYENHFCKGTDCMAKWKEENVKGDANPNWKGGISYEPYPPIFADKRFKAGIRERDNFTCQNPQCSGVDSVLTIHHIDYRKENCEPENLITLCRTCNSFANRDRAFWQAGYEAIIRDIYAEDCLTINTGD